MKLMVRFLTVFLVALSLFAQSKPAKQPSSKVDKALRERISRFYQLQVDGQFRDAEELVAKDTKNYFYSLDKIRYLSFALQGIEYSDDAKRATAKLLCERNIVFPGFAGKAVKLPVTSTWKIEKGKWYWYVDQQAPLETPFGKMARTSAGGSGTPSSPFSIPTTADFALNKVKADKTSLSLKPGETGEVTFTNTAPGPMTVSLQSGLGKTEVSPLKADMKQNETVTVKVKPLEGAASGALTFRISPTGEMIKVDLKID